MHSLTFFGGQDEITVVTSEDLTSVLKVTVLSTYQKGKLILHGVSAPSISCN